MFWHSLHGGQLKSTQLCVSFTHYSCPIIRSRAILSNPTTDQYRNCPSLTRPLQMTHYKDWGVRRLPEPAHAAGLMQTVIIFGNRALQLSGLRVVVSYTLTVLQKHFHFKRHFSRYDLFTWLWRCTAVSLLLWQQQQDWDKGWLEVKLRNETASISLGSCSSSTCDSE